MNIINKIQEWAKDTVDEYNRSGKSFYTQSPLNIIEEAPIKLLVLGINPGSVSEPFEVWMNKENWKGKVTKDGLSVKYFLEGNPSYVDMRNKERNGTINSKERWRYWDNLCGLLKLAGMNSLVDKENEKSFVLTNIYLGSTKKVKGITTKDFNDLKEHAFKLIDILQPECIICLGLKVMDSVLEHYLGKNDKTCQVPGLPIRYKLINGMRVFGFHHPAYYYSQEEKGLVGNFLGYYSKKDLTDVNPLPEVLKPYVDAYLKRIANRKTSKTKGVFDYNELIRLLGEKKSDKGEQISNIDQYREEKKHRIPIGKNNVMKLTISPGDRRIGIRLASVNSDNKWVTPQMVNKLLPILEELEKKEKCKWIREKEKSETWFVNLDYKGKTEEKLCNIILNTIDFLKDIEIDNV